MKQCDRCFGTDTIITWEAPENRYGKKFLHICTRCGHTAWPDTRRSDAEDQASSSSDDNTAL